MPALQGVKVQQKNSLLYRLGNCSPCYGCGVSPNSKRTQRRWLAGIMPFPQPYVEALGARWARVEAVVKGSSKSLKAVTEHGGIQLAKVPS